ncbi:MAG: hypothetical protein NTV80_00035 [Verrucomicrobia bacterium]|nr:hypothetical protein [Verrucomicrobiota bacterium]
MPTPLDPTPSATDEAVPAAANPPGSSGLFQSIEILRRSHTALLRGQRKESGTKAPTVAEIVEFMHRARATGRIIAAPESRDAIQGIVDYWYGILMLGDWKLVGEIGSLNLEEYDLSTSASASIKPAQPESEAELQARDLTRLRAKMRAFDERWAKGSRGLLRRLLLRLFTLSEVTNQARLSQLPKADELLKDSATTDLVRELVDAGLLQTEASAAGPNLAYVLSDERLLKEWEPLREAVKERRSLREMATGWERSGKSVDALLEQGRVLELAKDYVDLIGPEGPFLTESRTASIEKGQRRSRVKSAVIAVLVLSVVVAVWQWREAEVQSELAETRRIEAENSAKNASLEAQKARAAEKEAKEERAKVEEQTKATMALADEKQNLVEDSAKQKVLAAEEKKEAAEKLAEKTLKAQLEAVDRLNQIAMGNRNAVEQLKAITPLLRAEDRSKLEGALSALGFSLTAAESGEETAQKLVEQTSVASPAVAVVAKAEVAPRLVKVLEGMANL